MSKEYTFFKITDLELSFEKFLENKIIMGHKDKNMYGHITIHILNGRKHYIEISEKSAHESVK